MPKKKSVKKTAAEFRDAVKSIRAFLGAQDTLQTNKSYRQWMYDYAIIWLYMEFEYLVLNALVGAINNDTTTLASRTGIKFPKHLTDEVCEYIIAGNGYFDFRGRSGLIDAIKDFVPDGHYLLKTVRDAKYTAALDRLVALRNFAAHGSASAKARAKTAVKSKKIASSGAWLSTQGRFNAIADSLEALATEIETGAPY